MASDNCIFYYLCVVPNLNSKMWIIVLIPMHVLCPTLNAICWNENKRVQLHIKEWTDAYLQIYADSNSFISPWSYIEQLDLHSLFFSKTLLILKWWDGNSLRLFMLIFRKKKINNKRILQGYASGKLLNMHYSK